MEQILPVFFIDPREWKLFYFYSSTHREKLQESKQRKMLQLSGRPVVPMIMEIKIFPGQIAGYTLQDPTPLIF
jgi:hypothetical protein